MISENVNERYSDHLEIQVRGCVALFPTKLPGECLHPGAALVHIHHDKIGDWQADHKIDVKLSSCKNVHETALIGEEIRERTIALMVIASRCGATGRNEILVKTDSGDVAVPRWGAGAQLERLNGRINIYLNPKILSLRSQEEWDALKRIRGAFESSSFANQFESFVGAVDAIGRIRYPNLGVGDRFRQHLSVAGKVSNSEARAFYSARNAKVHENSLQEAEGLRDKFWQVSHLIADDLAVTFGIPPFRGIGRSITNEIMIGFAKKIGDDIKHPSQG
jgi:hypothetical protein